MQKRFWENQALALWLAPVISTFPLIPFFAIRQSPLFLGRLMGEPLHPFTWAWLGPVLSGMAVVFDGTILAYLLLAFLAIPAYFILKENGKLSVRNLLIAFATVGVAGSQLARLITQGFRQPALRDFSNGPWAPLIGLLCGLAAGALVAYVANRRISSAARSLLFLSPIVAVLICAFSLVSAAGVSKVH